ncbi:MAG: RNA polymerase sigma factor [Planctomycetota bacterium]|nr:RNA polymerase sigma factor [Planctomycetota bacterium]
MNSSSEDTAFQNRLARAKDGDKDAFRELILAEAPAIESFISSRLSMAHQRVVGVDDVVQETFVSIHRDLSKAHFDSQRSFSNWCIRISENRMLDMVRRNKRKKRGGDMRQLDDDCQDGPGFVEQIEGTETKASVKFRRLEEADIIREAMAELPSIQRKATEMKYVDGRNNRSIALMLNKSRQAVDGLLKRAKAKLRVMLRGDR